MGTLRKGQEIFFIKNHGTALTIELPPQKVSHHSINTESPEPNREQYRAK
jgi:hypothetical protein